MDNLGRRSILKWIGTAFAAAVIRPIRALAGSRSESRAVSVPLLRIEDFENGILDIKTVALAPLVALLHDLNARWRYDLWCHGGSPGPDSPYLSRWVDVVKYELESRGHDVPVA